MQGLQGEAEEGQGEAHAKRSHPDAVPHLRSQVRGSHNGNAEAVGADQQQTLEVGQVQGEAAADQHPAED